MSKNYNQAQSFVNRGLLDRSGMKTCPTDEIVLMYCFWDVLIAISCKISSLRQHPISAHHTIRTLAFQCKLLHLYACLMVQELCLARMVIISEESINNQRRSQ